MSNGFILPIDKNLSGATTPGQRGPGGDGNKCLFRIPQSSDIIGDSPQYCSVSYIKDPIWGSLIPLQRCSRCILCPRELFDI